jgi:hypothetical protein
MTYLNRPSKRREIRQKKMVEEIMVRIFQK